MRKISYNIKNFLFFKVDSMKLFFNYVLDSIRYAISDKKSIFINGILHTFTSVIFKFSFITPFLKLFVVTYLILIGYGSYVSWYTLKGSDNHPKFRNILKLTKEGFKKSVVTFIYTGFLIVFFLQAKNYYINGNILVALLFIFLFCCIYLFLIGGLLNRYLHKGKFLEAFNLLEICRLIYLFDIKSFIKVIIAVVISQIFAIIIVMGYNQGFSLFAFIYSIVAFFLAPFFYIGNKRLVGLNVCQLLANKKIKIYIDSK